MITSNLRYADLTLRSHTIDPNTTQAGSFTFKVPRHSFQRGSERFRELATAQELRPDGTYTPIVLPNDITDEDFGRFLDVLYPV
jgi:hypothetical protein